MAKNTGLAKILAIIGGILVLVDGVLSLLGILLDAFSLPFNLPGGGGLYGGLGPLLNAIIAIVIGLFILISTGVVKSSKTKVGFNGIIILVLGILALVFGGFIGPVLVIIGGILLLI
ncbi:MAG: hypothetical protein ACTSYI_09640 [Promethearchaeota archaeon]